MFRRYECPQPGCKEIDSRDDNDGKPEPHCTKHGLAMKIRGECRHCRTTLNPIDDHCGGCGVSRSDALWNDPKQMALDGRKPEVSVETDPISWALERSANIGTNHRQHCRACRRKKRLRRAAWIVWFCAMVLVGIFSPAKHLSPVMLGMAAATGLGWCADRRFFRKSCKRAQQMEREAGEIRNLHPRRIKERIDAEEQSLIGDGTPLVKVISQTGSLAERARQLSANLALRERGRDAPTFITDARKQAETVLRRLEDYLRDLETYRVGVRALFDECRNEAKVVDRPLNDFALLSELADLSEESERLRQQAQDVVLATSSELFAKREHLRDLINEGIRDSGVELAVSAANPTGGRINLGAMDEAIRRLLGSVPKTA